MNIPICFYHSADLDGKCSAAIVLRALHNVELYGINYGDLFPWDKVQGRNVVMVDFSLQPFSDMELLARKVNKLVWIDHHKTALRDSMVCGFPEQLNVEAFCGESLAGCELTWKFYFGSDPVPRAVELLGRYDVWDHSDPRVVPFQYGMHIGHFDPDHPMWELLLNNNRAIDDIVSAGDVVVQYTTVQNAAYVEARSYLAMFNGLRAIVCNKGLTGSKLFDSVYDPEKHDLMITFCRLPSQKWSFSLYSTKPEIDCGAIAKRLGGGGHPGAAGFQSNELPEGF